MDIPYEYFCNSCGQLRLSFIPDTGICRNCGSNNIIKGGINELDKEKLKQEWVEKGYEKTV